MKLVGDGSGAGTWNCLAHIISHIHPHSHVFSLLVVQSAVSTVHSILKVRSIIPIRLADTIRHRLQLGYPSIRDRFDRLASSVVVVSRSVVATPCCDALID